MIPCTQKGSIKATKQLHRLAWLATALFNYVILEMTI